MTNRQFTPSRQTLRIGETLKSRAQFLTAQHKGQSTAVSGIVLQVIPTETMDKAYKTINNKGKSLKGKKLGSKLQDAPSHHTEQPLRDHRGGFVDSVRIGFTATKKIGGAVIRNRAKRRLRALAHGVLIPNCKPDYDYVLIARQSTVNRPWQKLENDVIKALKILNVYAPHGVKQTKPLKNDEI